MTLRACCAGRDAWAATPSTGAIAVPAIHRDRRWSPSSSKRPA